MIRLWIRRVLNLLLWLNLCLLAGTAGILALRLPQGPDARGLALRGWTRHEWGDFHQWAGVAFLLLVIVHLVMAWSWLKSVAAKRRLWPVVGGLLAGLGLALFLVLSPVTSEPDGAGPQGMGWRGGW